MRRDHLAKLYDDYNSFYFGGKLLPIDKIISTPRFKKANGRATLLSFGGVNRISISISDKIIDNEVKLKNVLVHEMIHVKQYQDFLLTGDLQYLDEENLDNDPEYSKGHGRNFKRIMGEICSIDPNIAIKTTDDSYFSENIKRGNFHYFDVSYVRESGVKRAIFYTDRPVNGKGIGEIKESFEHLYGRQSLVSIEFRKTKNPSITNFSRLTSRFEIRKKQVPIHYSEMDLATIADIESILLDKREYAVNTQEFAKSLANTLVALRRTKHLSFTEYLLGVVSSNNGIAGHLGANDVITFINMMRDNKRDVEAIYSEWKNVRGDEIKRSSGYYETVMSESIDRSFMERAKATVVNFGVNRIALDVYIQLLRSDLCDRFPSTLLDDGLSAFQNEMLLELRNRDLVIKSKYLGMDESSYVVGCVLSKLNDGYRVKRSDTEEYEKSWKRPSAQMVAQSDYFKRDVDSIFEEMLILYAQKSFIQCSRVTDRIVSGWTTFISRGVQPKAIESEFLNSVNVILNGDKHAKNKKLFSDEKFYDFFVSTLNSSIQHCFGGNEIRRRSKAAVNQLEMFG